MTWLIRAAASQLLVDTGLTLKVVVPTVIGTLATVAIVDIMWLIIGKTAHVMLMASFYHETTGLVQKPRESAPVTRKISPAGIKRIGWLVAGILLIIGISAGITLLERINIQRTIAVTAHRGSKLKAPENTLSSLRQAIADGADYSELDVQTTADGRVVVFHDADFMRIASVSLRLQDMTYDELGDIDVGSWFAPEFSSERVPTLQEAIDVARGRIKLNIELKFNRTDPTLAEKVGHIIRQKEFASGCVVSSLNFPAVTETKQAFPEVKAGFIVFHAVGNLSRMEADFLSINAARATPQLVRDVHRLGREIHVWTVSDLSNALTMIEMGVDNIITDDPEGVRSLIIAWNQLSDSEKIALMLRNLIVGIEPPQPSEL